MNSDYLKLNDDPLVEIYDNFLTEEECKHFIKISQHKMKRSLVNNGENGKISQGRTSSNTWISHNHDNITQIVSSKISKLVKIPLECTEKFQVIYYNVSQEYRPHYDSWVHDNSLGTLRGMKYGGARLITALCYLNNVKKGGGTNMVSINKVVDAKMGRLLIFENTLKGTNKRHPLSKHAGMPVIEGEKYAFNLWFKEANVSIPYIKINPSYYSSIEIKKVIKNDIHVINNFVDDNIIENIKNKIKFTSITNKRNSLWINRYLFPDLLKKIEKHTKLSSTDFENFNLVEYKPFEIHGYHHNGFSLDTEKGLNECKKNGQRIYTIVIILSDNIIFNFKKINKSFTLNKKDLLLFPEVLTDSFIRDKNMGKIINNKSKDLGYLINIFVRSNIL